MNQDINKTIRSFVRRSGRMTLKQKAKAVALWPIYGISVNNTQLDFNLLFNTQQPLVVEIGFGNGNSLFEMAINTLNKNFIGIEVYEHGINQLLNKIHQHQLTNLKIIKGDALKKLQYCFIDNSIDTLQLFFPDPWHKKKHHKRRIMQNDFLDLLTKKIINNGIIHIATDWQEYAEYMMKTLENHPNFKNTLDVYTYSPRPQHRPITKFEQRGHQLQHKVWDLIFLNIVNQ